MWYPEANECSLSLRFNHCAVEALLMPWLKRDIWKAGVALACLLLFLTLTIMIPLSASAYEGASRQALPGLVQAVPTVDATATMTALNEEKLKHENDWLWSNGVAILSGVLSALVLVGGVLIGFWQWRMNRNDIRDKESKERQVAQDKELRDREDARRKEVEAQDKELRDRAEERFKAAVTALGDKNEGTQVGGAILLRSFLNKDDEKIYGRYYAQIFDLAVAYLRLSNASPPSRDKTPTPLTTLRHALIVVLRESYPLVRRILMDQKKSEFDPRSLDASSICLDGAYLVASDLSHIWMIDASLIEARLGRAKLHQADLRRTIIRKAFLNKANLSEASLFQANLSDSDLSDADLRNADLRGVKFNEAILTSANLSGSNLGGLIIFGESVSAANLEAARSLKDTNLRGVTGLSREQLEACKAKGAIVDEETLANASQSTVSPPEPSRNTDEQASAALPAQASTLSPTTDAQR